jgi:hypothetical protein
LVGTVDEPLVKGLPIEQLAEVGEDVTESWRCEFANDLRKGRPGGSDALFRVFARLVGKLEQAPRQLRSRIHRRGGRLHAVQRVLNLSGVLTQEIGKHMGAAIHHAGFEVHPARVEVLGSEADDCGVSIAEFVE